MATLSMISQGDPDTTAYLYHIFRTNKPEQQNKTFWFPTPENPGKPEDHTPIQTQILKEIIEPKDEQKLNPQESSESRNKFLKRLDWTDTLLRETEKQASEDILVDYHDIFARHRMDIGMNTDFMVKLTPKDEETVYSQSLPMPIHLKEDLIVELAPLHKYGIITVLPFSMYRTPIFAKRKCNGKLRLHVDLRKISRLIAQDYTNNYHPVSTLSDAAQHLAGKPPFCKFDCPQAYHCLQTSGQSESSRSILLAEFLPTKNLHKFSAEADRCLIFQVSCVSAWTQLSKLTNVLNTGTTWESKPIMLRSSPGTFGQSASAFAQQD